MSGLLARRHELPGVEASARSALWRAAARTGSLHAGEELVVCAFGAASALELTDGIADVAAPQNVANMLGEIRLEGDHGPGGTGVLAVGSLPFDPAAPGRLVVPSLLVAWAPTGGPTWVTEVAEDGQHLGASAAISRAASDGPPGGPTPAVLDVSEPLSGGDYAAAVAQCVAMMRSGDLVKVVLARSVVGRCEAALDAAVLAEALHGADPSCALYAYQAGAGRFVGASPELIIATSGSAVSAHPLAGTVALAGDDGDAERLEWLLASAKNRVEHGVVVDDIVERLTPLCDTIAAADSPSVVRLSTDARLGTWIDGKLRGDASAAGALRALAAVHPTPAVGGVPRDAAMSLIERLEGAPRGTWAGPVGWVDADGTSTWTLALRALLVEGARFEAWAGAGIVADSVPDEEREETEVKLSSVLRALSG